MRNKNYEDMLSVAAERLLEKSLLFNYPGSVGEDSPDLTPALTFDTQGINWYNGNKKKSLEKTLKTLDVNKVYFLCSRTNGIDGSDHWMVLFFENYSAGKHRTAQGWCDSVGNILTKDGELTENGEKSLLVKDEKWGSGPGQRSFLVVEATAANIIRAANFLYEASCSSYQIALASLNENKLSAVDFDRQITVTPLSQIGNGNLQTANCYFMMGLLDYYCLKSLNRAYAWASQKSLIPYTSHNKIQHYTATFVWTAFISFIVTTAFYFSNFKHLEDKEHALFNRLDHLGHQLFAVVALIGLSFALGAIAGAIHYGVNCFRGKENHSDLASGADHALVDLGPRVTINNAKEDTEKASLLGYDKNGAAIHRIDSCHPFRLVYPLAPMKSFLWVTTLSAIGFALGSLMDSAFFDALAGGTPLSNGTFTNCTIGNKTVLSNAGCVEDFTHFGSVVTLGVASALAIGGVATLFHYVGANVKNYCDTKSAQEYYLVEDGDFTNKIV